MIVEIIISSIISFVSGGALLSVLTMKLQRKKISIEVSETMTAYYRSEIEYLIRQIEELRKEMKSLTDSNIDLKKQLAKCHNCKFKHNVQ